MDSTPIDIEAVYTRRLAERRTAWQALDRRHAAVSYLRLAIAASAVVILVVGGLPALAWLLVPVAAFLAAAVVHARVLNARDRAASAVAFYECGLARIRHEWIGRGRTGDAYRPADHPFAADLDLFGRGSLFELLATSRTRAGEDVLARWLLTPASGADARSRQSAVRELADRLDLRETVAVLGDHAKTAVDAAILRAWAASPVRLSGIGIRVALGLISAVTIGTLAVWVRTGAWSAAALAALAVQIAAAWTLRARVATVVAAVDAPAHDLEVLAGLLRILESATFESPRLVALQGALGADLPASREIGRLSRLIALLQSRQNILFALPAALVLWTSQCAFAIEAWRIRAGAHIPAWLDAIGELETLMATGGFAAEHPAYVYPAIVDGDPAIDAEALAHPALGPAAIANDIALGRGQPSLVIVSGSNMSGKSTWLRTIGVTVVLAWMGAPVRAARCRVSPLAIGAAIRVQDSLVDGRSRFFAEITRLKQIMDLVRSSRGAVLFLLDEILSGTNSHDRRVGAGALAADLVAQGAIGLITTHDLAIAAVADTFGAGRAVNAHFSDEFVDGALRFDYRLRPGIVQTRNALALMRSIGLDVSEDGDI